MAALLGFPAPAWVDYAAPAILPISAWAFYQSLGPSEEKGLGTSREIDPAETEIWATRNAADSGGYVKNLER